MTNEELVAEARRLENDYGDSYEVMTHMSALADALEASEALVKELEAKLAAVPDAQAERVSMEVLNEYRRIAAWLESQAALRGATGDTMHGLAAEALATLIDHEYSRHTIPLYGMLDVWMALYGTSHPGFDEFYDEHGYAEAWSRLMAEVRSQVAVPDAATEVLDAHRCDESAERAYKRTIRAEAERDAALSTVAKVRELHQPAWDSVSAMYQTPLCGCGEEYRECPTVQVLPPSLAINAGGLNPEGMTP